MLGLLEGGDADLELTAEGGRLLVSGAVLAHFRLAEHRGRCDDEILVGDAPTWRCSTSFREHSSVSLSYVAFSLQQSLRGRGVSIDLPGQRDAMVAGMRCGQRLLLWVLSPASKGRPAGVLHVVAEPA